MRAVCVQKTEQGVTVVALDLHDSLGHDGDGVGVPLSDGEEGLGEVLQHLRVLLARALECHHVLQGKSSH